MVTILRARGDRSIREYLDPERGTISREIYVNPDIFEQEMEQIFQRCWLFLGHESQLPNPGDFMMSRMGTEEVIVVRDRKDHQIRAFLNSCRHRGMKVCRYDQGNGLVFTCPFHAWTYDTRGRLVGIGFGNHPEAYNGEVNKDDWGLTPVGRFKNFYGSLWATWDPKAPSFEEYLGPFTESLRHCLEASDGEDGGLEMFTPFQRHRLPTNWKVPGFTSVTDLTHTAMTHRSAAAAALHEDRGEGRGKPSRPFPQEKYAIGDHNLGHGGMCTLYNEPGVPEYVDEWFEPGVDEYFREQHARKSQKYANRVLPPHGWGGGHFAIFPCVMVDSWRIRWYHPHSVGMLERWTLSGVDKERAEARQRRAASLLRALQRPGWLLRVGRHGELELRLPGQPGRQGAQAGLFLRQRAWSRHVRRSAAGCRLQRFVHRGGSACPFQPLARLHGSCELGRAIPDQQVGGPPHLVGARR